MNQPSFHDMDELFQRLLDDQIEPDEMKRLQEAMLNDPQLQDYYLDSIFASTVMRRCSQVTPELSESDLIQVLSSGQSQHGCRRFARLLSSIAAVLIIGALIFGSVSLFRNRDQGPSIGTLAGTYEAKWQETQPRQGEYLYAGSYDPQQGVANMELDQGTSLLLEAPCQVELTGLGQVTLRNGRLRVVVSPQAKGFRVQTPTARITDLGTEFGVIAHLDGSTEAHVLKGRIHVALDPNKVGLSKSLDVLEGQAATIDATGQTLQGGLAARGDPFLILVPQPSQPSDTPDRVNLADIVGGGNGCGTGRLDRGIDLVTGRAFRYPATKIQWTRRRQFVPTVQFSRIDGVFVPNGALGPIMISTTGLTFSRCPRTMGSYFGGPANSGKSWDIPGQQTYPAWFNGLHFGTSAHPALTLHPNAGITFDLDQIRKDNPRIRIERFTALCGIPKDLPQPRFSSADVWILLDGVVGLHLNYPVGLSKIEDVDVPIPDQTRFLTLVATCSGLADYSWIIFGDPFVGSVPIIQEEAAP